MPGFVSKHIIIRYVKEVNMFNTVQHPRKEEFAWEEREEAINRYKYLKSHKDVKDVQLQIAKVYSAGLEELLI